MFVSNAIALRKAGLGPAFLFSREDAPNRLGVVRRAQGVREWLWRVGDVT
ncbi:hypothetical protein M2175_004970 [Bradyrhizobium elkanii]|nr:hypothetical protein [Bradyrhizobium elkanii]MCS3970496.1 hypothetical protein [Bradyrhizobium japonicum]